MNRDRWERLQEIFASAVELPSAERSAYVDIHCGDDAALRQELMRLLAHPPSSPAMLDRPMVSPGLLERMTGDGRLVVNEVLAGRFTIVRHLGAGGMGDVYEAIDNTLGGRIAIKTIRAEIANNPQVIARFQREISLARQVTHPNICRVFDLVSGTRSSTGARVDFLTMEYLEGETLSAFLKREAPLTLAQALPIIEQVAIGLDAAHAARIMHRDLKASNIMLTTNATGATRAVITDFGLARSMEGGDTIATGSGWGAGTPAYMAPEQIEGRQLSHSADIYALGVVMYEMATGVQPYTGESPLQVAVKRLKEQPARPRESNAEIEPAWEAAILKCLAYEPANRFSTAGKMAEALRGGRVVRLPRVMPQRSQWLVLAGAAVLCLLGAGWYSRDGLFGPKISPAVERLYLEGVNALHDGAFHKATQMLELASRQQPEFAAAHCRLAEAWQELDYRDKAREELVKALDASTRSREERLLRDATKAFLTGEWDKALAALEDRVGRVANAADALMDIARLHERAGRSDRAIAVYQSVLERDKNRPGAMHRLAVLLRARNRTEESLQLLQRADEMYRSFGNAEGRGEVLLTRSLQQTSIPRALDLAEEARRIADQTQSVPLRIRAEMRVAQSLERNGESDRARELVKQSTELAQREGMGSVAASGLNDIGLAMYSDRKYEVAEGYLREAISLAQRFSSKTVEARGRLSLAQSLMAKGSGSEALELVKQVREYAESTGNRTLRLQSIRVEGDVYRYLQRIDQSRAAFQLALQESESDADRASASERLGRLAIFLAQYEEAERSFGRAAEFYGKSGNKVTAQYSLLQQADSLRGLNRLDEAAAVLDQLRRDTPANLAIRQSMEMDVASLDWQKGNTDRAFAAFEKMLAEAVTQKQAATARGLRLQLCGKYAESGRSDLALKYCQEVLPFYEDLRGTRAQIEGAMAVAYTGKGQSRQAIELARNAVKLSLETKAPRDVWYYSLVLAQSLHAAGNPEWREVRKQADGTLEEIGRQVGKPALELYLKRPDIARRYQLVRSLN